MSETTTGLANALRSPTPALVAFITALGTAAYAQGQEPPAQPAPEVSAESGAAASEPASEDVAGGAHDSTPPVEPGAEVHAGAYDSTEEAAPATAAGWGDLSDFAEQQQETRVFSAKLYGFIDSYWEKVANTPDSVDANGDTVYAKNPYEFDVLNFNIMAQGAIYEKYRFFLNLASPGSGSNIEDASVLVRNAWVEAPLVSGYLLVRAGKTYRRFGLYNEILDAVPTFIGIEPPELFDSDHLMVTRTTNLMLHGRAEIGPGSINYSLTTGNDERDAGSVPIGADLHLDLTSGLKLGTSFYTSGGDAVPSRGVGEGSPRGGVINWMDKDRFSVFGGYAQFQKYGLILQAEYWYSKHDGTRNADAMQEIAASGTLNPEQMRRFFVDGDPTRGVREKASYGVQTFYFRGGYEIAVGDLSTITPYVQFDFYENPETIKSKSLGGDKEAGLADDGRFEKYTIGAVIRPVPQVALKIDGSGHRQIFNGTSEFYPEARVSLSYLWELVL